MGERPDHDQENFGLSARNEDIYNYYGQEAVIDSPRHIHSHNASRTTYGPQLGVLGEYNRIETHVLNNHSYIGHPASTMHYQQPFSSQQTLNGGNHIVHGNTFNHQLRFQPQEPSSFNYHQAFSSHQGHFPQFNHIQAGVSTNHNYAGYGGLMRNYGTNNNVHGLCNNPQCNRIEECVSNNHNYIGYTGNQVRPKVCPQLCPQQAFNLNYPQAFNPQQTSHGGNQYNQIDTCVSNQPNYIRHGGLIGNLQHEAYNNVQRPVSNPRNEYEPDFANRSYTIVTDENNKNGKYENNENDNSKQEDTTVERLKLAQRIRKLYANMSSLLFSKNSSLFDGIDWINVTYTFCNGLKIYAAQLNCPICFGRVTPQNREKEAGRSPRWDLMCVKRHLENIHPENGDIKLKNEKEANQDEDDQMPKKTKSSEEKPEREPSEKEEIKPLDEKVETTVDKKKKKIIDSSSGSSSGSSYDSSSDSSSNSSSDSSSNGSSGTDTENDDIKTIDVRKRKHKNRKENKKDVKNSNTGKPANGGKKTVVKRGKSAPKDRDVADVPDWKKPGVEFAWAKFKDNARYRPAFIFPKEKKAKDTMAEYITMKGLLSVKHPIVARAAARELKPSMKSSGYLRTLKKFNEKWESSYE